MATRPPAPPPTPAPAPDRGSVWRHPALRKLRPVIILFTMALVVASLYFAQAVLVPIALAGLLTFLLGPLVDYLHRLGLPRSLSVMIVVLFAFTVLGGVAYALFTQAASLADELPRYRHNIRAKISDLRGAGKSGSLEKMKETVKDVAGAIEQKSPARPPQPVVVEQPPGAALRNLPAAVGPWMQPVATAGLVVILVIFMLLERQPLRNRVIRLVGYRRLTATTKALDEASQRISRYLLMQSLINAFFGGAVAGGLWLLGVPYALLWGFLAGVLRFIPYAGPWLGALLPITLSLAVFPGWVKPLLVIGLFVVLELFTNMVLEVLLYAGSAGVSEVALLVAVAFWTWLWGPIGLLLATPLTVCLVVFAKHIPDMEFVAVLMADDAPLPPDVHFYQRVLAMDQDEAAEIVEEYFKTHPREAVYDETLIPALNYLKRDRETIDTADEQFVLRAIGEIVENVEALQATVAAAEGGNGAPVAAGARIVGIAVGDRADELALEMLGQVLDPAGVQVEIVAAGLSGEAVALAGLARPTVVCLAAVPPGGFARTRYLCKRLRARYPELRILVGRWGAHRLGPEQADALLAAGADAVGTRLLETRDAALAMLSIAPPAAPATEAARGSAA